MNLTPDQLDDAEVYTADGEKLGKVDDIYADRDSNMCEWVSVHGGFLGLKRRIVPIDGATMMDGQLHLRATKQQLEDAPDFDDSNMMSVDDEQQMYSHYGVEHSGRSFGSDDDLQDRDQDLDRDGSLVRHEEELALGKRRVSAGSARLRKWVETDRVSQDIPLERDRVEVRREPINKVTSSGDIGEDEVRVDLTAEEPVVEKRNVAKERVSLDRETMTDTERVDETVRKERVGMSGSSRDAGTQEGRTFRGTKSSDDDPNRI